MLLTQTAYVEGALALCLYSARLVDDHDNAESASLLGLLTPITKTWPSEYGLAANDIAIQIHGGYGYTRDFDVEQLWRDNRLNPIHEGTTGIQAIDLLGRKVLRDGSGMEILGARIAACIAQARTSAELAGHAEALASAWTHIRDATRELSEREPARAMDNATLYLWAFGHVVVAWLWLEQASLAIKKAPTACGDDQVFLAGKVQAAQFFYSFELPKIYIWLKIP
jgi:hypothetical protein